MPPIETHSNALLFIEMGLVIMGLAVLARMANRLGFSGIPLYLLAGLAFGNGGIAPLPLTEDFLRIGAEIGVLLLLFMLGLEYTGEQLGANLKAGLPAGAMDLLLNFPPGFACGLIAGWTPIGAALLGGITYISSSGVIAKVLGELKRMSNVETPAIISILVLEDLAMAVYLPLVAILIAGGTPQGIGLAVGIAVAAVAIVLLVAIRYGGRISKFAAHESDEIVLLTALGMVLLVAGLAERLQVSAAIGAFLVGIALSGPIAAQSHRLFSPLRDLFAALFFFLFGLEIDPATLVPAIPMALALGAVTAATKVATGYWAGQRLNLEAAARWRAGAALVARGEFSIVIAELSSGVEPALGPLAAAYVLTMAILGPTLARLAK
jgi:monovalent cation:H+ antiporter-2, CPA2 family